jgi:hypothetical protein
VAARNEANMANSIGGIFSYLLNLKNSGVTPDARRAVRSGDPYYSGGQESGGINGGPVGYSQDMAGGAQAADDFYYGVGSSGNDTVIASPISNSGLGYEYDVQEW